MDGVEVSVMRWLSTIANVSPCTRPSCMWNSLVYQSRCVLASSTNFLVLMCPARCGHCARRSESGMALGMMSLQSSHLIHISLYPLTTWFFNTLFVWIMSVFIWWHRAKVEERNEIGVGERLIAFCFLNVFSEGIL